VGSKISELIFTIMRLAFDIRGIGGDRGGKGIWTANVLETIFNSSPLNQYYLYTDKEIQNKYASLAHVHVVKVEGRGFLWHWNCYKKMVTDKIEVFLATESYIIPFLHDPKKLKVGLVVHDLVAFKSPAKHQKKATWIEHITLKKAVQTSRWIFTVSESTQNDLIERYPHYRLNEKMTVVYAGVRAEFLNQKPKTQRDEILKQHSLDSDYLLMASTLEPRKNIVGALEAYAELSVELQKKYPLVIVGKKGWYFEEIFQKVIDLKLEKKVKFLGYVSDEDLASLMQGATAFLFPSFYEGFGLPILEAMALGVPVISSHNSSLPEVGGEAVHYVDPYDAKNMTEGMTKILENPAYRKQLIDKEVIQVKQFSWKKTATRIMQSLVEK